MNFTNLKTFARKLVTGAKAQQVPAAVLAIVLNKAKDDIALRLLLYKKHTDFDIDAETGLYYISDIADDFVGWDKRGVWWLDSNDTWIKLDPTTELKLDFDYPEWRNEASSDPLRYFPDMNTIQLHPTPDTDYTNGGRLYHAAKPPDMTVGDHYPFPALSDQKVEIAQFSVLDECIFAYTEWYLKRMVSKKEEKVLPELQTYLNMIEEYRKLFRRRPDLMGAEAPEDVAFRGPTVC